MGLMGENLIIIGNVNTDFNLSDFLTHFCQMFSAVDGATPNSDSGQSG